MPTPSPIIIPSSIVSSGMVTHPAEQHDRGDPCPDPAERDGDGQTHGQHGTERQDEHDHGEGEADQLGLGWLDRCQVLTAHQHLESIDPWRVLGDEVADAARLGVIDVGGQVHLGEAEVVGQWTAGGDLAPAPLGIG